MDPSTWFGYGVVASFLVLLVLEIVIAAKLSRIRRNSSRAATLVEDMKREWDSFNRNQSEQIRQEFQSFEDRATQLEATTQERMRNFEELVTRTREEVQSLEAYLRDVFEVELKALFDSFDTTVGTVITEMKNDLQRGVNRLEQMEKLIDSRMQAQEKMIQGHGKTLELTGGEQRRGASGT